MNKKRSPLLFHQGLTAVQGYWGLSQRVVGPVRKRKETKAPSSIRWSWGSVPVLDPPVPGTPLKPSNGPVAHQHQPTHIEFCRLLSTPKKLNQSQFLNLLKPLDLWRVLTTSAKAFFPLDVSLYVAQWNSYSFHFLDGRLELGQRCWF